MAFVVVAVASASAKVAVAPIDTSDFSDPFIGWGGGDRSLTINELRASVVFFGDNIYVVVTVLQTLGQMDFCITNTNTGEYLDGEFNALPGSYPIPISGSPGYYTIAFILPDGRSFYGTFEL